jgi:hypothetical protein
MHKSIPGVIKFPAARFPYLWVPLSYILALMVISPIHHTFDEWGGTMQYFAGREILSGVGYHGWTASLWPPLYSFLIGLGSLILPGFTAGKIISILSSAALLLVAYFFSKELFPDLRIALWTQVFLALSPIYFFHSLLAHNHMLDAFLFNAGLLLFISSFKEHEPRRLFMTGLICGLAGLSRYTSYTLLFLPFYLVLFQLRFKAFMKSAVAFWGGFALVSLPWWIANATSTGSPFYTLEALNICSGVVPGQIYGSFASLWWCRSQPHLNSLLAIFLAYPTQYVKHFLNDLIRSGTMLLKYGGVLAPFVIPGFFVSVLTIDYRILLVLFGELVIYVLFTSQADALSWFLLCWSVVIVYLGTFFVFWFLARIHEKYPLLREKRIRNAAFVSFVILGIGLVYTQVVLYEKELTSIASLADLNHATQALKDYDPALESKVIMATNPARAYYAGSKYLSTPPIYDGPVEGLVSYRGIDDQLKDYAPKYPSHIRDSEVRADYLIYTRTPSYWQNDQDLPQFSFLLDPESEQVPDRFKPIYCSDNVVVYEIDWK